MEPSEVQRAVEAGRSTASALGLRVDDAVVVHNSNRIAVRLTPCDVLARVAPMAHRRGCEFEVVVARHLAQTDSPVAELEPRVEPRAYEGDGFVITLWTYYQPLGSEVGPAEYSDVLARLHAGMRQIDLPVPHFTDRVADAQRVLSDRERSPELPGADRELLSDTLRRLSTAIRRDTTNEQLLHGEPHPGNVLSTRKGPLFIDLETCCRGPVEFDIAHGTFPVGGGELTVEEVCEHYPGANRDVVEQCRILVWAMITTWRWEREDQLPNRDHWRAEGLKQLRAALAGQGIDRL